MASTTPEEEEAVSGKINRGRKRKIPTTGGDVPEPKAKVARMSEAQVGETEPKAPVALMSEAQVAEAGTPESRAPGAFMSEARVAEGEVLQLGSV